MTRYLPNKRLMIAAFAAISAASLGMAYIAQYGFGLHPCILCLYQRVPFWSVITIGVTGALWNKYPRAFLGAISALFAANTLIAFYHTGVEQKWWTSFIQGCSTPDLSGSIEDLMARIEAAPVVSCDVIPWVDPVLGLSMANWNVPFCGFLAILAAYTAFKK